MRKDFAELVRQRMAGDERIWVLTGDLGFGVWDRVREEYPDRFINCGAAEQAMLDIACGLALEGKIPVVYSITPFLIYRPFETLRTYVAHEKIPTILAGAGRDKDYAHDGISHWANDVKRIVRALRIPQVYPKNAEDLDRILKSYFNLYDKLDEKVPIFISLRRN